MKRNDSMTMEPGQSQAGSAPDCSVSRRPVAWAVRGSESIEVTLEVPGVSADGVELICEGRRLVVRACREPWTPPKGVRPLQTEIPQGSFELTLELPAGIATERIGADLQAGLLVLSLPKQVAETRTIPVSGA